MKLLKNIWNYFFGKKEATTENVTEELREFHKRSSLIEDEPQVEETVITPPQEFRDVSKQNNLIPSRFEGESFEEYKKRQVLAKLFLKKKKKGELIHVSQKISFDKTGKKKTLFEKGKTFTKHK